MQSMQIRMTKRTLNLICFAAVALATLAFTHAVGRWVDANIPLYGTWEVNSLIHLTHVRNFGGVFGLWQGGGAVFSLISGLLLTLVVAYLLLARALPRYEYICFGFIVGGGSGNILDRLLYGSVIDYIDIQHIPFWHYIFNAADVMIHVGVWPLLLLWFFYEPQRDTITK